MIIKFLKQFILEFNSEIDRQLINQKYRLNVFGVDDAIVAMIVISLASAATSAYSSIQQGKAQSKLAQYQASVAKRNAEISQQNAELKRKQAIADAERKRSQGDLEIKRMRAAIGKSGVLSDTGSPLLAIEDQEAENELDVQSILYQGELAARGFENEAGNFLSERGETIYRGQQAKTASKYEAGRSLLAGASSAVGAYNYGTRTEVKT